MIENLNQIIDHTLLKADATEKDFEQVFKEAQEHHFFSVCVPPCRVREAREALGNSRVRICSVVGFPLGNSLTEVKAYEARQLVEMGVHEIDMVMNIGFLKDGRDLSLQEDIEAVIQAARPCPVKVILETSLLSPGEIKRASEIIVRAGGLFIKTSTGFGSRGAEVSTIELIRESIGKMIQIKASGGVQDYETAAALVAAGANRLGCSQSVKIIQEWKAAQEKNSAAS
ncbi:MAG: deoxyribose-phosphate aldolase [Bradymonadales bacterium]|nr:MAG: deoxyribose-phosphate aldolase [Bradymonadales bacterium]